MKKVWGGGGGEENRNRNEKNKRGGVWDGGVGIEGRAREGFKFSLVLKLSWSGRWVTDA